MELQNYINNNLDNYVSEFKNKGLIVKNFNKDNLILVKYKFNEVLSEDWMKYCKGCIIDKLTNKLIFIPPVKSQKIEYPITENNLSNTENIQFSNLIDGTMINLFFHNNKWIMSTRSDIGCLNKWNNKTNFKNMFEESIGNNNFYDYLSTNFTYSFLLLNKNNRNISYIENNCVILIEVYNKSTFEKMDNIRATMNEEIYINNSVHTLDDLKLNFDSIEAINNYFLSSNFNFKGINININNNRLTLINPNFIKVKKLCINTTNLHEKYIYLKKNKNIKEYLIYFPEVGQKFLNYSNQFTIMINELHDNYIKKHIKKEINIKEVPYQLRPLLYDIHKIYIDSDRNKKINKLIIEEYVLSLDIYKILFVLNY
jgi:hypothetical protein